MDVPIEQLAQQWLKTDRNPATREEISVLLEEANHAELELRLRHRIAFGTAGLRARMSAGFSRMNDLTVIQASQGLAVYVASQISDSGTKAIVIGHDARHHSSNFARLTAAVFLAKGFEIHWLGQCHTPLVPFAIGGTNANVGVMVTASHNPKDDNGYKVYWSNGCQIIPPHDKGIAAEIVKNLITDDAAWDMTAMSHANGRVHTVKDEMTKRYMERVVNAIGPSGSKLNLDGLTYTPMHGVGQEIFLAVAGKLGVGDKVHIVSSQAKPDPEFPTVRFPNPEEKGALDEAIRTATDHGDTIILANDPDADRFAVAELVDGSWKQLTGNQLGVLLASFVLDQIRDSPRSISSKGPAFLASAVSSRMLAAMATKTAAFHFEETLTGFKWLGNRALDLSAQGYDARYAYEEAIGFMLADVVHDKDGVAAAALFMVALAEWKAQGLTPWTKLQALYIEFGYFEEANTYLISPSPEVTARVFGEIRARKPKQVGSRRIARWRDLTEGVDTGTADEMPVLTVDKTAQMITCELDAGVVFTVRGSGTEPKIKLYIEGSATTADAAQEAAQDVLQALLHEWFKPAENGLKLAGS